MVHRCTDQYDALDIRQISREVLLSPRHQFSLHWARGSRITVEVEREGVRLLYRTRVRSTEEWTSMDYRIRVTWTDCNYGGQRAWWICPTEGCGRRVAVLFSSPAFACRHCQKLAYGSQRDTQENRGFRKADKLRKRMGWVPGIAYGIGVKPKGMHWATFDRLKNLYWRQVARALGLTY